MNVSTVRRKSAFILVLAIPQFAVAQGMQGTPAETARIFGLDVKIQKIRALQSQRAADSSATLDELSLRQEFLEAVQASCLDVDSVLAELENEQSDLGSLRTALQSRRDKTVGRLTTAALIAGSALGTAVSATQFTTLGSRTQNVGDALGIGSGAASTILSILAARGQSGPGGRVGHTPNMLAPLLGGTPVLHTYYPPAVLQFLRSVPPGEDPSRGTRLEQLMAEWDQTGRLSAVDSGKRRQKVAALTAGQDTNVKLSIDDLSDRIAMLGDLRGRVSLIKRDLAVLMHSELKKPND